MSRTDWTAAYMFGLGEGMATWHYDSAAQAILRGVATFTVLAVLYAGTNALHKRRDLSTDATEGEARLPNQSSLT